MLKKIKHWWKKGDKVSKILMIASSFLMVFSIGIISIISTSFAASIPDKMTAALGGDVTEDRVQLFPELVGEERIALVPFIATDSTGKQYHMYCLEKEKDWYEDTVITKSGTLDAGYSYIIQNGYPAKSLTGNDNNDSFLTQVAVWLYQDRIAGVADNQTGVLTANQKRVILASSYASIVNSLVNGAINAQNTYQNITPKFSITTNNLHLDSSGNYLITDELSVSANIDFDSYQVAVDMSYAEILNSSNTPITGTLSSNEKFKIRIPLSRLTTTDLDLKITIIINYTQYEAYQYSPPATETGMQKSFAAVATAIPKQVNTTTTLQIPTGSIEIEKVNSNNKEQLLEGAEIEVRRAINNELIETFTSTTSPKAITNLLPGKYIITENKAPSGFLIETESKTVTLDISTSKQSIQLTNSPLNIQIQKIDATTKQPIAGATIKIVDSQGTEVYRFTSTTGYQTIPNLEAGTYQAIEVEAPDGYYLNTTPVSFEINEDMANNQITIENEKNQVEITKIDATTKELIEGATLRLTNKDTNKQIDEWKTTTNAHTITGLSSGNYQITEIKAPNGYSINESSIDFTISKTQSEKITIQFPNTKSQIMISKIDKESGQLIANATLAIYNESGDKIKEFISKTTPTTIEELALGTYTIKELKAPDGYQLNKEPVTFEVTENTKNLQIKMENTKNKILIGKIDADTKNYISGAKLQLTNEDGEKLREWTSSNELYEISGLAIGVYYIEEITAPTGYIKNPNKIKVTITENTTTDTYTIENKSIAIRIAKVDSSNNSLVAGATLELLNSSQEVICTWKTTNTYQTFTDLTEGKYYVRETSAPNGYILNKELVPFTIDNNNSSFTVSLKNEKTTVKLGKIDATTKEYIAGATLKLSREDGNMEPITFTSENKATIFSGLALGTYILEEINAPNGYITSASKITFELDSEGKTKNISLKSNYISIEIENKKIKIDTKGINGYQFQLYSTENKLLDTYNIEKEIFTSSTLENGNYILKQTKVPDGTILNPSLYTFSITDNNTSDIIFFANDYTKVNFEKKEMVGGNNLSGAHFILRNEEGTIIKEWNSKKNPTTIEKLSPGKYTLNEVKAPDGYKLNNSLLTFEVKETTDIQTITMYDALEVEVPNTSKNNVLYTIFGILIITAGIGILGYTYHKEHI